MKAVSDVGFFVRRSAGITAASLEAEAVRFQDVIREGRVRQISAVD